jgi:DNA-binding response OmpR family regulator
MSSPTKKRIGAILLKQKAISAKQLEDALAKKQTDGDLRPLVTALTEEGIIRETQALKALSEQSGCPGIDLNQVCIRLEHIDAVERNFAEQRVLLPVLLKDDRIFVAMANPSDRQTIAEIEFATGKRVFPYIAMTGTLKRVIGEAHELKAQGRRHYVGPSTPAEVVRKAGASVPPPKFAGAAQQAIMDAQPRRQSQTIREDELRPAFETMQGMPGAVVVDDDFAAASQHGPSSAQFADPMSAPAESRPRPPQLAPDPNMPTALVVDDEPEIRRMLGRVLSQRGFYVVEASDGESAFHCVRETSPSLLVLDAMLPRVHGFEIARQLKRSDRYRHIPIIMVSAVYRGWRFQQDIKANYGVDEYVEKPFKVAELLAAIDRVMQAPAVPNAGSESGAAEPHIKAAMVAYKHGDLHAAIAELQAGLEVDPLSFQARFQLGLLYGQTGNLYDAIQELEAAVAMRANDFQTLKNLAVLYQSAGFRHKATEMWERCLQVAPDDATRDSIRRHLMTVS